MYVFTPNKETRTHDIFKYLLKLQPAAKSLFTKHAPGTSKKRKRTGLVAQYKRMGTFLKLVMRLTDPLSTRKGRKRAQEALRTFGAPTLTRREWGRWTKSPARALERIYETKPAALTKSFKYEPPEGRPERPKPLFEWPSLSLSDNTGEDPAPTRRRKHKRRKTDAHEHGPVA